MNAGGGLTNLGRGSRRPLKGGAAYIPYLAVSLFLLASEALIPGVPLKIRAYAGDIVAPILFVLEQPVRAVQAGLERLAGASDIYLENQDLRDENDRLRQWREAALALSRENERLRAIVRAPGREVTPVGTGQVVGIGGGAFERSVILNLGGRDGVRRNLPVLDDVGVVGRIIYVGHLTSRVLLVTDLNSRVPVRMEGTGALAIIEGQNEPLMRLTYLSSEQRPKVGDRVLTSGHGGIFPPDLPIGRVVALTETDILVEPVGLLGRLDILKVLDYLAPPPEALPYDGPRPDAASASPSGPSAPAEGGN